MRFKVAFRFPNVRAFPYNYNHWLVGLLYELLEEADPSLARDLHGRGLLFGKRSYKPFTFSMLFFLKRENTKEGIRLLSPDAVWYFSSAIHDLAALWALVLARRRLVRIGPFDAEVRAVVSVRKPTLKPRGKYVALSPIVVYRMRDGRKEPVAPTDPEFKMRIKKNTLAKWRALYREDPPSDRFSIWADPRFLKRRGNGRKRVFVGKNFVVGYLIPVWISGDPRIVEFAYDAGIGEKTGMGFGMLKIANPTGRDA